MNFKQQLEAIGSALLLIQKLPGGSIWSLTCTEDDDAESPSVLNIFVDVGQWPALMEQLKLGRAVDRSTQEQGEQFIVFRHGTLFISLIQQEDK